MMEIENLNRRHREVYDSLAEEYDRRADTLLMVTEASIAKLMENGASGGRALDIGCGAGITTKVLVAHGFAVTALDLSSKMIDVCLRREPSAEGITGDYLEADFELPFDVIVAFAYIHLFPAEIAAQQLKKMYHDLRDDGRLLIGTTKEETSSEGLEGKADYLKDVRRYRKRWTENEFRQVLDTTGFRLLDMTLHHDPFGKTWMDAVLAKR